MKRAASFPRHLLSKHIIVRYLCMSMALLLVATLISTDFPVPCTAQGGEEDVVINELMLRPGEGGVWVEIYNSGNASVSVDDWLISDEDGLTYQLGDLPNMPAGGYIVVHFDHGDSDTEFGQTQPNALHIYTGWKNVRWTRHTVDSDQQAARMAVGYDIVPGGKPEIILNKFKGGRYVYESKADMTAEWNMFEITNPTVGDFHRTKPIDIDDDGLTDIVGIYCFTPGTRRVNWIKQPAVITDPWGGAYQIDDMEGLKGLDAGNINGDALMDVVVSQSNDPNYNVYWYECPADPTVDPWNRYTIDNTLVQPGGLALVDLDGDRDLDIVAVGSNGEEVVWYEHPANPVNAWTKHTIAAPAGPPGPDSDPQHNAVGELIVADLDDDLELEVIVSESRGNKIVWYEYTVDPTGAWTRYIIDDNIVGPSGLDLGDYDIDGDMDVTVAATGGCIAWYPRPESAQLRDPNWPKYFVDSSLHLPFFVSAADFDLDGDLDICTADQNHGKVYWYENEFLNFTDQDQCALFKAPDRTSDNIIDFLAWCGDAGGEDDLAVTAGIWQDGDFVDCTGAQQNKTVARDRYSQDTDVPGDWDVDCGLHSDIPTKGTVNFPYPTNSQLSLLYNPVEFMGATPNGEPPGSMPEGMCLANFSSYTFRVNVTNPFGWSNLEMVELNISQGQEGHRVLWTQANNTFNVYDPHNSINLVSAACIAETDDVYFWHLNFTLVFHWWYEDEGLQDVTVTSRNSRGYETVDLYNNRFNLVKSLNFTGEMDVRDSETNEILESDAWVIPGQVLNVTGPKVVYDTQEGEYYASDSQFNVVLGDSEGNSRVDYTSTCYPVDFTIVVPENALTGPYDLTMSISDLPVGAISRGLSTLGLRIDAEPVEFSLPSPDGTDWNTANTIQCTVTISDDDSGVDGGTIEYRLANGSTERFGEWQQGPRMPDSASLEPEVTVDFPEGPNNWIQWRCRDVAGGGPYTSPPYQVPVDTRGVCFHEFYPPPTIVQYDPWATVQITLTDFDGSGIDTSSFQVARKPSGEDAFGNWYVPLFSIQNQTPPTTDSPVAGPETVRISAFISGLNDGPDNCIKFRSFDMAGNGYTESEEYNITVEYSPEVPVVSLVEPADGSIVRSKYPFLRWQLTQPLVSEDIHYNVYLSSNESDFLAGGTLADALIAELAGNVEELGFSDSTLPALTPNMTYFWTVISVLELGTDKVHGSCSDGVWEFTVFIETSGVELASDTTYVTLNPGESANITIRMRNLGISSDSFSLAAVIEGNLSADISLDQIDLDSNEIKNATVTISAPELHDYGRYNITVIAYAQSSSAYDSLVLEVAVVSYTPEELETGEDTADIWVTLSLTMLLILVIITLFHYIFWKRKENEVEIGTGTENENQ